jgi:hypothetical protein
MNRKWFVVAAALVLGTGLIASLPGAGLKVAGAADESICVDWATAQAVTARPESAGTSGTVLGRPSITCSS